MLRSLRVPGGSGSRSCLTGTPRTFTATLPGVLAARVPMTWSPRRSCPRARHELSRRLVDRLRAKADRARLLDEILGVLADPDIPRGLPDPRGFLSPVHRGALLDGKGLVGRGVLAGRRNLLVRSVCPGLAGCLPGGLGPPAHDTPGDIAASRTSAAIST